MTQYTVYLLAPVWNEVKELPSKVRNRVRDAIEELATEPRPHSSKAIEASGIVREVRRIRLDRWRILYAITESDDEKIVDVLAVRRRPPYDYEDLEALLRQIGESPTSSES